MNLRLMPSLDLLAPPKNPRWMIVSEAVEQSPREKVLKAGRVVKQAQYRDRGRYTGDMLRDLRRDHGVGRPPWWRASAKDYWEPIPHPA